MSVAQFDERTAIVGGAQFLIGDGTAWKTLATGALSGQRVDDISICSSAAGPKVAEFRLTIGAVNYQLGSISVPAGSGYGGVAPVQVSALFEPKNQIGWLIGYNQVLAARVTAAMGAAEVLDAVGFGGAL